VPWEGQEDVGRPSPGTSPCSLLQTIAIVLQIAEKLNQSTVVLAEAGLSWWIFVKKTSVATGFTHTLMLFLSLGSLKIFY
jgi:hypothetical protein